LLDFAIFDAASTLRRDAITLPATRHMLILIAPAIFADAFRFAISRRHFHCMISPRRFDFSIAFTFYADFSLFSSSRRRLLPFFAFALARLPAMLMLIFACHFIRFDAIISLCQRFRATPQLSPAAITLPPFCRLTY
jgi:hypothetical protein